jgi:hypothetical protein
VAKVSLSLSSLVFIGLRLQYWAEWLCANSLPLLGGGIYYPYFLEEKPKTHRSEVTCSESARICLTPSWGFYWKLRMLPCGSRSDVDPSLGALEEDVA